MGCPEVALEENTLQRLLLFDLSLALEELVQRLGAAPVAHHGGKLADHEAAGFRLADYWP